MRINTNTAALNSYNQLNNTQNNLTKSLERLSSGKRINSAADDAAGLAISEKMGSQTRGLGQAQRNAQDGISMLQTAEGALKESHSILQRMRELSVQAANDTNTEGDRAEIQKEVDQLTSELDRISTDTEFNTQKLLNGDKSFEAEMGTTSGTNVASVDLNTRESLEGGDYDLEVASSSVSVENFSDDSTSLGSGDVSVTSGGTTAAAGEAEIEISGEGTSSGTITVTDSNGNESTATGVDLAATGTTTTTVGGFDIDTTTGTTDGTASFDNQVTADMTVTGPEGEEFSVSGATSNEDGEIEVDGFGNFEVAGDISDGNDTVDVTNKGVTLQIGANEDQNTTADINDMSSAALEVESVDVTTQSGANTAIETIDDAIESTSAERSKLGATQNRLEHTINNLNTSQENLTAAESRISDVDMAKEMMNMSKQQILSQAGNAMMAQANQLPQGVLQLLG